MGKLGSALACLLFAIPFGGVGAWATWAIGSTLMDAYRAQDWVKVRATVDSASLQESSGSDGGTTYHAEGRYRYTYGGQQHTGTRLGISTMGGSDNIDDWHHEVNARLADARSAGLPVTVWVNPDNPAESVFDRELRWGEILFLVPFSLAFGGVGVGALVAMAFVLKGKGEGGAQEAVSRAIGAPAGGSTDARDATPRFLWVFAFFWNAMSWPIAFLAIPDIVAKGEWIGLLVVLFPLVGLGLLWAAASATWNAWLARRGAAGRASVPRRVPARSAPGTLAAQATRAMFDPQGGASLRPGMRPAGGRDLEIPPAIAELEESGGTLTVRYSARRRLGLAIALFAVGAVLTLVGVALFMADGEIFGAIVLFFLGSLLDAVAVSLFLGSLVVTVKPGEIAVEKRGLLGRRTWRVRRESIRALRPVVSYTVNGLPYFSLFAETGTERVPLGNSLKGTDMADAMASRISRSLGLDPASVKSADASAAMPPDA